MDFCIRRWAPSVIFCSKSLHGFTAVIRSAMSINKIFIQSRYIFEIFLVVDIRVQLHSVWFPTWCRTVNACVIVTGKKYCLLQSIWISFVKVNLDREKGSLSIEPRHDCSCSSWLRSRVAPLSFQTPVQFTYVLSNLRTFQIFMRVYKRELHILTSNHRFLQRLYQSWNDYYFLKI